MEDTKEEIEVSIFPGSASEDNFREKIIDSVGEEIEEEEKEKISCEENVTTEVRRSERMPKPRKFDHYVTYMCIEITKLLDSDLITVAEALSTPDAEKWKQAMSEELQSFEENDVWELEDMPEEETVVDDKWVFKRKIDKKNKAISS